MRLFGFIIILITITLITSAFAIADAVETDCAADIQRYSTKHQHVSGNSHAETSPYGDLIITLDENENGRVESIFTAHLVEPGMAESLAQLWQGKIVDVDIDRWGMPGPSVLQIRLGNRDERDKTIVIHVLRDCFSERLSNLGVDAQQSHQALGLAEHQLSTFRLGSHEAVIQRFKQHPLMLYPN